MTATVWVGIYCLLLGYGIGQRVEAYCQRKDSERTAAKIRALIDTGEESEARIPELGDGEVPLPDTQAVRTTDTGRAVA